MSSQFKSTWDLQHVSATVTFATSRILELLPEGLRETMQNALNKHRRIGDHDVQALASSTDMIYFLSFAPLSEACRVWGTTKVSPTSSHTSLPEYQEQQVMLAYVLRYLRAYLNGTVNGTVRVGGHINK